MYCGKAQNGYYQSVAESAFFNIFTSGYLFLGQPETLNRVAQTDFGSWFRIMPNIKAEIWTEKVWKYSIAFGAHDDGCLLSVGVF